VRRVGISGGVAALVAMTALAGWGAAPATSRSIAVSCHLTAREGEHLGPTYVTSLSVTHVSCAAGKRLVRAYYRCRVRSGGVKGHCDKPVLGFRCTEHRQGIAIQFDARVTCVMGSKRVVHTYTQDT
jgi:hypothetical protein